MSVDNLLTFFNSGGTDNENTKEDNCYSAGIHDAGRCCWLSEAAG
jgi:hypothetical protein